MHRFIANFLLLLASLLLSAIVAEGVIRLIDEVPLFAAPLPLPVGSNSAISRFDDVPLAASVKRDWFFLTPPSLPNRTQPPEDWERWSEEAERAHAEHGNEFRSGDMFKVWNSVRVGDPCTTRFFGSAPGRLFVFDPPDGSPYPNYRFPPDTTAPDGLVTNALGWRGPPVPFQRGPRTVRIVFVGASTTISNHHMPYAYPEFIGHWLNVWSAARGLDIRFETMNAARESIGSTDIAAIVRQEVLPLLPDLVVYYEGANQFRLNSLVADLPEWTPQRPVAPEPRGRFAVWLQQAERYSAIARRIATATGWLAQPTSGEEWPKPAYDLVWPTGLDERDPDLSRQDLPVHLSIILRDLDDIRADLAAVRAEFAVSSFTWMVSDGLKLDPVRQRYTLDMLNASYGPFRYRDLARLAAFQNRSLAKYARIHGLRFIDVAGMMPSDPDLFSDAIHKTYAGERIMGWVFLQQLVPVIERHLASGAWPRPVPPMEPAHPAFRSPPRMITFQCRQPAGLRAAGRDPPADN